LFLKGDAKPKPKPSAKPAVITAPGSKENVPAAKE
jgi:hypothetical protein